MSIVFLKNLNPFYVRLRQCYQVDLIGFHLVTIILVLPNLFVFGSDLAPPHCASSIPSTFPGPNVRTASSCEFTLVVELASDLVLLFGIAPPLFAPTILPVQPAAPGSGRPGAAP